jgi:hypothetical protein
MLTLLLAGGVLLLAVGAVYLGVWFSRPRT